MRMPLAAFCKLRRSSAGIGGARPWSSLCRARVGVLLHCGENCAQSPTLRHGRMGLWWRTATHGTDRVVGRGAKVWP